MAKNNNTAERLDFTDVFNVDEGDPVDAKFKDLEFSIKRRYNGAEVILISELSKQGKAKEVLDIMLADGDAQALADEITKQAHHIETAIWTHIMNTSGLDTPAGGSGK